MTEAHPSLQLHAWFDGELDAGQSLAIEAHLAGCPACRREIENLRQLRQTFAAAELYCRADDALGRRIRAKVKKTVRARSQLATRWFPWSAAAAAAIATFVIGFAVGPLLRGTQPGMNTSLLASEAVAANVRSLMADHLTDVKSSDEHTVKPWFDGKLDFSPPVRDLAAQGFPLAGGRLDYLAGRPVAALVYKRRLHTINVFVWPVEGKPAAPGGRTSHDGYNVIHWSAGGMNFWAVSDLNSPELTDFVSLLQDPS